MKKAKLKKENSGIIASEIFAFTCAGFMFKIKSGLPLDIKEMCIEFDKMIYGLKKREINSKREIKMGKEYMSILK